MMRLLNKAGFTLIELLLSIAIIGILVGLSMPVYYSFQSRNDLDISVQGVASSLRRAQTYARSSNGDSALSVEIQSSAATLFKGTNFAGRTTTFDEVTSIPSGVTVSGITEVQFAKLTGLPNTSGTITLTSSTNGTRTITVNAKGVIDY